MFAYASFCIPRLQNKDHITLISVHGQINWVPNQMILKICNSIRQAKKTNRKICLLNTYNDCFNSICVSIYMRVDISVDLNLTESKLFNGWCFLYGVHLSFLLLCLLHKLIGPKKKGSTKSYDSLYQSHKSEAMTACSNFSWNFVFTLTLIV